VGGGADEVEGPGGAGGGGGVQITGPYTVTGAWLDTPKPATHLRMSSGKRSGGEFPAPRRFFPKLPGVRIVVRSPRQILNHRWHSSKKAEPTTANLNPAFKMA
jgi:hypothetical protein